MLEELIQLAYSYNGVVSLWHECRLKIQPIYPIHPNSMPPPFVWIPAIFPHNFKVMPEVNQYFISYSLTVMLRVFSPLHFPKIHMLLLPVASSLLSAGTLMSYSLQFCFIARDVDQSEGSLVRSILATQVCTCLHMPVGQGKPAWNVKRYGKQPIVVLFLAHPMGSMPGMLLHSYMNGIRCPESSIPHFRGDGQMTEKCPKFIHEYREQISYPPGFCPFFGWYCSFCPFWGDIGPFCHP